MNLPSPGPKYEQGNEAAARAEMQRADQQNLKRNSRIEGVEIVLTSPNGTRYLLGVNNAGTLTTTVL